MASTIICGAAKSFFCCFELIDKICELVRVAAENDRSCEHILSQSELIKAMLLDLSELELSRTVIACIENLEKKLNNCDQYMSAMSDRKLAKPRDLLQSRKYRGDLERLKKEMDSALLVLNTSLVVQSLAHHQKAEISNRSTETGLIPGKPPSLRVEKRAHNRIKLVWDAPSENPEVVSKYEVQYRRRWKRWDDEECVTITVPNCVVDDLSSDTYYWFRVRAVNENGFPGRFSDDVLTETKYSSTAKKAICTGATIGGVLVGTLPFGTLGVSAILNASLKLRDDDFGDGEVDPEFDDLVSICAPLTYKLYINS